MKFFLQFYFKQTNIYIFIIFIYNYLYLSINLIDGLFTSNQNVTLDFANLKHLVILLANFYLLQDQASNSIVKLNVRFN